MTDGPLALYRALRQQKQVEADPAQALAAEKLQGLANALRAYRPAVDVTGWRERLGLGRRRDEPAPQGLYLYGPVGRGKSMLMELFFRTAPIDPKRRVHFHAFMVEAHDRLHRRRAANRDGGGDAIADLADDIADEATLLCFDEFQVANIADAMILGRLFEALLDRGTIIVLTSNLPPDDLYAGGLQRERFLPFIELIKERLDLIALDGLVDYRRRMLLSMEVYYAPLGAAARAALEAAWDRLTDEAEGIARTLAVKGRQVLVPRSTNGVAWVPFADLCERPLGAEDYLALAQRFPTVILEGVPRLSPERRDVARRFVALVDALYEHRVKLLLSADAPADGLYPEGDAAFEFRRTASRLIEMQSAAYLSQPHAERG